jgi:hypothetical protein
MVDFHLSVLLAVFIAMVTAGMTIEESADEGKESNVNAALDRGRLGKISTLISLFLEGRGSG